MHLTELVTGNFLPHELSGADAQAFAIVLMVIALGLMFAGRSVIKGLAFLIVGLAGAGFGLALGGVALGVIGSIIGGILGFIVGGLIGILLVQVGLGAALGYFGYLVIRYLAHSFALAVVAGVVLFFVGLALATKLLELVTAAIGGVVLYGVLIFFGAAPVIAAAVSLILAVAGFTVQRNGRRQREAWRRT